MTAPTRANLARIGALSFAENLCKQRRMPLSEVLGRSRLTLSFPETASVFNVDHSSVLSAVHKRLHRHETNLQEQ